MTYQRGRLSRYIRDGGVGEHGSGPFELSRPVDCGVTTGRLRRRDTFATIVSRALVTSVGPHFSGELTQFESNRRNPCYICDGGVLTFDPPLPEHARGREESKADGHSYIRESGDHPVSRILSSPTLYRGFSRGYIRDCSVRFPVDLSLRREKTGVIDDLRRRPRCGT